MKLHKRLKLAIILLIAMLPYMAYANDSIRIAKRDSILSEITGAQMPQKSLKILSFGAKGDGKKDRRKRTPLHSGERDDGCDVPHPFRRHN